MKIKRLVIFTSQIEKQRDFYSNLFGYTLIEGKEDELRYQIGETELVFRFKANATPYHFAFNIPSDSIHEALHWLKSKADILMDEGNEIQDFIPWKAKAIYCYDADKNIVEFIAREKLEIEGDGKFSADSVLSISEIGLVSEDNLQVTDFLQDKFDLLLFAGQKEVFTAIGDDFGLFISMDKTKRNWFPTGEEAFCSDFEIEFSVVEKHYSLLYKNKKLILS